MATTAGEWGAEGPYKQDATLRWTHFWDASTLTSVRRRAHPFGQSGVLGRAPICTSRRLREHRANGWKVLHIVEQ